MGSTIFAITLTVGSLKNGSITAVLGSGTANISDTWIPCQPRMDEPSKPTPSTNVFSSQVSMGKLQCCQVPSRSVNFRSTISALFFSANSKNSVGFICFSFIKGQRSEEHTSELQSR